MTPSRPNRRTFLKSVALGAATLALDSRARADAGRKRAIKKSLKFGMIGEGATVKEKFAVARECGFDGVEMDSPSGLDLGEVLAAKAETGIEIPGVVDSVHWRDTLSDPDASVRARGREALVTALSDCRKLGGTTVLLVPAVVNAKVSYADAYARSQEEIRKVLPAARESGVKIAIENVWNGFLLSPLEAARYVDELGTEVVVVHAPAGRPAFDPIVEVAAFGSAEPIRERWEVAREPPVGAFRRFLSGKELPPLTIAHEPDPWRCAIVVAGVSRKDIERLDIVIVEDDPFSAEETPLGGPPRDR